ncbi:glycine-rich cell wall structural protein 1.8-like [Penaeus japonicus]|uniref:glycine-rich cell wall structural protein 1.8-like n=1 Tax=Penaeus japonicus TaxID=27405 RepID=UPI001C711F20|nr:glycine-rich cell wall structural protein 1.8-like [Penaeus japonicus]
MCTSDDAIATVSMTKPVRKGFLTRYKKRFIGSNWREEWAVLHEDSSLEWYKEHDEADLLGAIVLKEAPEMIAAGPFALYVPGRPDLPKSADPNNIMVFGNKAKDKMHWFLCKNADELNQWMTAISNTLPPPPEVPKAPSEASKGEPPPYNPVPSAPPEPYVPSGVTQSGGRGGGEYPRGGYGQGRGGGGYGGGGYGQGRGGGGYGGGYGGGGYGGGGYGRGGYGGGQNTVVIDRGNDGIGNFATGMMLGSALGGWGHGWGFGYGFGVPMHVGFGGFHGAGFHNQETNITNNYNITNNETVNNEGGAEPGDATVGGEPGGLEPDAEMVPDGGGDDYGGVDPGLLEEGYEDPGLLEDTGIDPGFMDDGGFEMGGIDEMGGDFDGGFDGGGFDMDMGDFDMGF